MIKTAERGHMPPPGGFFS